MNQEDLAVDLLVAFDRYMATRDDSELIEQFFRLRQSMNYTQLDQWYKKLFKDDLQDAKIHDRDRE